MKEKEDVLYHRRERRKGKAEAIGNKGEAFACLKMGNEQSKREREACFF